VSGGSPPWPTPMTVPRCALKSTTKCWHSVHTNGTGNLVGPLAARAAIAYALEGTHIPEYFCD
jgi:hypothetical protein